MSDEIIEEGDPTIEDIDIEDENNVENDENGIIEDD